MTKWGTSSWPKQSPVNNEYLNIVILRVPKDPLVDYLAEDLNSKAEVVGLFNLLWIPRFGSPERSETEAKGSEWQKGKDKFPIVNS